MRYCAAVLLLALLGACGSPTDRSRVSLRVVHAVPDGATVDIWIAGRRSKLFEGLAFGTATGYVNFEPGTYRFQVRLTGDPRSVPPLAESGDVVIGPGGRDATVIFGGLASVPATEPDALRVDVYQHGFVPESDTKAVVRFVHNAPGAPTFDLTVDDDDPPPDDNVDGTYVGLAPYTASDEAGISVDAADPEQLLVSDNVTTLGLASFTTGALEAGNEYFVIFLGSLQSPPGAADGFRYIVLDRFGAVETRVQNPRLYLFNAVADSTSVDVTYRELDGTGVPTGPDLTLDTQVLYGDLGGDGGLWVQLPPGEYEFTATVPGDLAPLGSELSGVLAAGEQYLFVVGGRRDGTWPFDLIRADEKFDRTAQGTATTDRWRIVHAAPDLASVFFGQVVDTVFTPLAQFPNSISYGDTTAETGADVGIDPFELVITQENQVDQYGIWDIVPVPDALEFVVLLGSIEVVGVPPQLSFVDTSTQPWTLVAQLPR